MAAPGLKDAIEKGTPAQVAELLGQGASLVFDDHGLTALHHAVRLNKPEIAKVLLDHGADQYVLLGTTWPHVKSPLFEAVKRGKTDLVTMLVAYAARRLERGPDLGGVGTPFAGVGSVKLARQDTAAAHARLQEQLDAALLTACCDGQVDVVRVLIANGADASSYPWGDDKRHRPLVAAAACGFDDVVAVLLAAGADVSAVEEGKSALERAVGAGRDAVVEKLLEAGAPASATDESGSTPLHLAAAKGFDRIALLLLERGADPNAGNARDETPRYLAAARSPVDRLLSSHGGRIRPYWKGRLRRIWLGPDPGPPAR